MFSQYFRYTLFALNDYQCDDSKPLSVVRNGVKNLLLSQVVGGLLSILNRHAIILIVFLSPTTANHDGVSFVTKSKETIRDAK